MPVCETCFRHCNLKEGQTGFCRARKCVGGKVICSSYGKLTALALDPIEKKPLAMFHPGSAVVSVGSYGCNLDCPFCQNSEISRKKDDSGTQYVSPEELVAVTLRTRRQHPETIGVAYTYNEMLTCWEYVRDTSKLVRKAGLLNVLVTNGTASLNVLSEILPYIDAMNIDLKCFTEEGYRDFLGGDLAMTKAFIEEAVKHCHVEVTTLVIPGHNDSDEEIYGLTGWLKSLDGGRGEIPYHLSRYFPRWHLAVPATDVRKVYHLADVARENLKYVFTGNC